MHKISLTIQPIFWLVAFLIGMFNATSFFWLLIWIGIVLISVLAHEMGHALTAIFWKQRAHIELGAMGGVTIRQGDKLSSFKEFIVVLMGPVCGIALALFTSLILQLFPNLPLTVKEVFQLVMVLNILWSILNLVPVYPLDGGKLMTIVLEGFFNKTGLRFSYLLSMLFALLFAVILIGYSQLIIGSLFLLFAFESFRSFRQTRFAASDKEESIFWQEMEQVTGKWLSGSREEAITELEGVCHRLGHGALYVEANVRLARYLLLSARPELAVERLVPLQKLLSTEGLVLLQLALYRAKEYEKALKIGEKAYLEHNTLEVALRNAYCAARMQKVQMALNWLQSAKRLGVDIKAVLIAEDFDEIRQTDAFRTMTL